MFTKSPYSRFFSYFKLIPTEIYVFLIALLYRLPSLGYDFINNDAFIWKSRGYAFGSALTSLDLAGTAVTYHPGVPLLWCQFIAIKIYSLLVDLGVYKNLDGRHEFLVNNQIQATVVVLLTSVLIALIYSQLKKIIGTNLALLSVAIILIEPFFIALSRTIHTDAMIALFMLLSVLYFYQSLTSDTKKLLNYNVVLAGVFAGLAFLTKSSGLFLIPFYLLISSIYFIKTRNISFIYKSLLVLAFSIVAFFAFWPAMWVQPIESINLFLFKGVQGVAIEEGHEHIWFGKLTSDPGPLFYPIVVVGRYSVFLILFSLFSFYLLYKRRKDIFKKENISFYTILVLYFVFYILMITLVSKKLDRYSLPGVIPIAILAAWAISKITNKKLAIFIVVVMFISRAILMWSIHPNYLAYYSPFIGGMDKGRNIIEPKWLVGYDEVAKYFNEVQNTEGHPIKVAIADFDYLKPFAEFEVLNIKHESERDSAEYFVLPVYRQERNEFYTSNYKLQKLDKTIDIGGVEYYNLYKVENTN